MYNGKVDIIAYSDMGSGVFFVCREGLHLREQQCFIERVYLMYSCVDCDF